MQEKLFLPAQKLNSPRGKVLVDEQCSPLQEKGVIPSGGRNARNRGIFAATKGIDPSIR